MRIQAISAAMTYPSHDQGPSPKMYSLKNSAMLSAFVPIAVKTAAF
jgi:hypothetical protein